MSLVLEVAGLNVAYGGIPAITDLSLAVEAGSIATVIGPNGAGKTTLLGAIMGVLPSRGTIRFNGTALAGESVEARVQAGMSLVPEQRELFASMSVLDNLRLGGFRHRAEGRAAMARQMETVFALFPRLRERQLQQAGTLSGGERQMLAMGRALMARPRLLMLDEPSLGLAPLVVRDIFRAITALRGTGVAILLIEQNARAALRVADRGYVLETGQITLQGDAAALAADSRVVELYLGSKGAVLFLKKEPKKTNTLQHGAGGDFTASKMIEKFFCFFLFTKRGLFLHPASTRARRTAVCPRLGRSAGITSRQSSYGVRISVSPSSAISVLRRRITSPPRYGWVKLKPAVLAVIAVVTWA
jgi:branched-chain amino acid transport system ATP-binding protein